MVEQRFCKPLVGSSNLSPGTTFNSSQATPRQHKVNAEGRADTVRIKGPTVKVLLVLAWAFGPHKMTATAQASGACKYMFALPPKGHCRACLFASPRTGDPAWADLFAVTVKDYRLFNYILDIVTHVPTLGYATLPNATVIKPSTAQAGVRLDILCNHHVICYCAMIDYKDTMATPTTAQDASRKSCILGPSSTMPEAAKALAVIINEFGVGDEKALAMLKALHTASMV